MTLGSVNAGIQLLRRFFFFFLNDPPPTEISPLPHPAAFPICPRVGDDGRPAMPDVAEGQAASIVGHAANPIGSVVHQPTPPLLQSFARAPGVMAIPALANA